MRMVISNKITKKNIWASFSLVKAFFDKNRLEQISHLKPSSWTNIDILYIRLTDLVNELSRIFPINYQSPLTPCQGHLASLFINSSSYFIVTLVMGTSSIAAFVFHLPRVFKLATLHCQWWPQISEERCQRQPEWGGRGVSLYVAAKY